LKSVLSKFELWMLLALVVLAVLFGIVRPKCSKAPVHVSPVDTGARRDTTVITTTDTLVKVVVNRDSLIALERKIQSLTDEKESWMIEALDLSQQIVAVDSQWAARFDSMAGMVAVQYRRGRIDIVQYQRPKYVRTSQTGTWRNTYTLRTKPGGGVALTTRRLPFDLGIEAAADLWAKTDMSDPNGLLSACLTMRTSTMLSGRAGVGWLLGSGPVLVAGVRLAWEF
jgi:hypothetical protein